MSIAEIEHRLTAIETELAALKANSATSPPSHPIAAIERIHGTFENDQALKQAMQLGRKWRQSDRPLASSSKGKRK